MEIYQLVFLVLLLIVFSQIITYNSEDELGNSIEKFDSDINLTINNRRYDDLYNYSLYDPYARWRGIPLWLATRELNRYPRDLYYPYIHDYYRDSYDLYNMV